MIGILFIYLFILTPFLNTGKVKGLYTSREYVSVYVFLTTTDIRLDRGRVIMTRVPFGEGSKGD